MRIDILRLENFRCFKQYELRLEKRFNLLIGDNGSGKTAILDALAVAAGSFLLGIPHPDVTARNIEEDDLRRIDLRIGQTATQEVAGNCSVTAEWIRMTESELFERSPSIESKTARLLSKAATISWTRTRESSAGSRTTRRSAKAIESHAQDLAQRITASSFGESPLDSLPMLGYYGTGRLWRLLKQTQPEPWGPGSRFRGYTECLNPASDQKTLFRWFESNERAALQKQERRDVLEAVRAAVISIIPGARRLWWDFDWEELRLEIQISDQTQTIPFHLLSDGYRNMLGMVADIAFRCAVLNPQLGELTATETEGIVLIDEIDLHLHPKWQRQVVPSLLKTFPKIQFIATSHSPFIIQSLYDQPNSQLWDITRNSPVPIESKSIEDIAEGKQHVELPQQSHRYLEMEKVASKYLNLLADDPNLEKSGKDNLRDQLDALLRPYSDDPAFHAFLTRKRLTAGVDDTESS